MYIVLNCLYGFLTLVCQNSGWWIVRKIKINPIACHFNALSDLANKRNLTVCTIPVINKVFRIGTATCYLECQFWLKKINQLIINYGSATQVNFQLKLMLGYVFFCFFVFFVFGRNPGKKKKYIYIFCSIFKKNHEEK